MHANNWRMRAFVVLGFLFTYQTKYAKMTYFVWSGT